MWRCLRGGVLQLGGGPFALADGAFDLGAGEAEGAQAVGVGTGGGVGAAGGGAGRLASCRRRRRAEKGKARLAKGLVLRGSARALGREALLSRGWTLLGGLAAPLLLVEGDGALDDDVDSGSPLGVWERGDQLGRQL